MPRKLYRRTVILGLGLLPNLANLLSSCHQRPQTNARDADFAQNTSNTPNTVTIAYQSGLAYFSLMLIKQQNILEKQFPNTKIEWKVLSSPSPIRDGMIANQIQVGAIGVPAFWIGWDRGLNWKLLAGLIHQDFWLVVNNPNIKSLKDFKPNHKIAVPDPNAVQAVTLRKAAQQQLGDPKALDANLQSISHPLGLEAFKSKQITAHFTAAPFQWQEGEQGGQVIVKSSDLFGGLHTGIGLVAMEKFYSQYPAFNQALYKAVEDASRLMRNQADEAVKILSAESEGKMNPETIKQWLSRKDVHFTTDPKGFLAYATFLKDTNEIIKLTPSINGIVLPTLQGKGGN